MRLSIVRGGCCQGRFLAHPEWGESPRLCYMKINTYDLGDVTRFSVEVKNLEGVLIDPGTLKFIVKTPGGVSTTHVFGTDPAVVRTAIGVFHIDVAITASGTWHIRVETSGVGSGAEENSIFVRKSQVV